MWLAPGAINLIGQLPTRAGVPPYELGPIDLVQIIAAHFQGDPVDGGSVEGYGDLPWEITASYQTGPDSPTPYSSISYIFGINLAPELYQFHPLEVMTWHANGPRGAQFPNLGWNNVRARGVLLTGFGRKGQPTPGQLSLLAQLVVDLEVYLRRPLLLVGHSDLTATSCPGDSAQQWLANARGQVQLARLRSDSPVDKPSLINAGNVIWGNAQLLKTVATSLEETADKLARVAKELEDSVRAVKNATGLE